MLERLRRQWKEFKDDEPGKRFQNRFEKTKDSPIRIVLLVTGLLVIVGGIVLLAVPGPGIPVIGIGAALLAQASRKIARFLDWLEPHLRKLVARWKAASVPVKGAIGLACLTAVAGLGLLAYRLTFVD